MRVLVVETDDILADAVGAALRDDGHAAVLCASHAEGLVRAESEPWDVFVVNGFDPASFHAPTPAERAALRRFAERAPVIVVTAVGWVRELSATDLGVAAAVAMPFDLGELLLMAEILGGHRGGADDAPAAAADGLPRAC